MAVTKSHKAKRARKSGLEAPPARGAKGKRLRLRLALLTGFPLLLLALVEIGLRVAGVGYSTSFFLVREDGKTLTTNPRFAWRFHQRDTASKPYPLTLPVKKQPGTRRVFVLGESAAQGTPAPPFGFARILQVMLEQRYPGQRFEVVNSAMRGINSHLMLPIARECSGHEPDLFVVYAGNNEAIGVYAPEPDAFTLTAYPRILRTTQALKRLRLGQVMDAALRALAPGKGEREEQDMTFFRRKRLAADDPKRAAVYSNFRLNLGDTLRAAGRAGAPVVLSTVAVNLRNFPPIASLHRAGLAPAELAAWETAYKQGVDAERRQQYTNALTAFAAATRIDDHYADLHFRMARCLTALGRTGEAAKHFVAARDWDAMPFRTDSRLNNIVRELAAQDPKRVLLVDAEKSLGAQQGVADQDMFNDHVHFSFDGDYQLARTLLPAIARGLKLEELYAGAAAANVPSRAACASMLAFTPWDEVSVKTAMVKSLNKAPYLDQIDHAARQARDTAALQERMRPFQEGGAFKQCQDMYIAALTRTPHDWQIWFNYGNLLRDFNDPSGAARAFETVLRHVPDFSPVRMVLGQTLWQLGRRDEATRHFQLTLEYDPDFVPARNALAQLAAKGYAGDNH